LPYGFLTESRWDDLRPYLEAQAPHVSQTWEICGSMGSGNTISSIPRHFVPQDVVVLGEIGQDWYLKNLQFMVK
jgi:hypothetical protein